MDSETPQEVLGRLFPHPSSQKSSCKNQIFREEETFRKIEKRVKEIVGVIVSKRVKKVSFFPPNDYEKNKNTKRLTIPSFVPSPLN